MKQVFAKVTAPLHLPFWWQDALLIMPRLYCGYQLAFNFGAAKLPNSAIEVDMPFLCFGKLDKHYPRKRLPDFTVYDSVKSLQEGKYAVLNFAADYIKTH